MPFFFAEREGGRAVIRGVDAAHLTRSLRARPGEEIQVVDPEGWLLTVQSPEATRRCPLRRFAAFAFAEASPYPRPEELFEDVFKEDAHDEPVADRRLQTTDCQGSAAF